jgi:hypothetical protein
MLRSLEAAGWIVTQSRFRPDRSQTSCVFQWAKAPDLHVRPPRTSASGLEFNIGSIQESKTYAAAAECDFRKEDKAPVAADPRDNCPEGKVNCPEADPKVNCPEGKENLPDSRKGLVNCPDQKGKANCPYLKPVANLPYLNGKAADSVPVNCPEQNGTAPVAAELGDNCPQAPVAAELVEVNVIDFQAAAPAIEGTESNLPASSAELPSSKPAIPAAPAIRKPSPKFIVIDGSKFLDINHGKDIYLAAVAGKLLNSGTVDRLAFFACWCAIAAKLRAGKVQHPERMMRFLLDNRKAMSAYPDHAAELKAREAVRFLFPEKPYNPHC